MDDRTWVSMAVCAGHPNPDLWFAPDRYFNEARAICMSCPVRIPCLHEALKEEQGLSSRWRHGLRGGLTPIERERHHGRCA